MWRTKPGDTVVAQSLSPFRLFATPWNAARQASLFFTMSQRLLRLRSVELVMPFNHLILCYPLLLLPSILPSIKVFSSELALHITWPKYWSFSFSISPYNEYSGFISLGLTGLITLLSKGLSRGFSKRTLTHKIWGRRFLGMNLPCSGSKEPTAAWAVAGWS